MHRRRANLAFCGGLFPKTCLKSSYVVYHDTSPIDYYYIQPPNFSFFFLRISDGVLGAGLRFCEIFFGSWNLTFMMMAMKMALANGKCLCP